MGKKILIITSFIILLTSIGFLVFSAKGEEPYFNQVELSQNNSIANSLSIAYYDTILSVGLDRAGLSGLFVVIYPLSDAAKDNFKNSELKAHVRHANETFYIFIDELDREEAIKVISHEIIHIEQYHSGRLDYYDNKIFWQNGEYELDRMEYDDRPWEIEAFMREGELSSGISKVLIQKN